ncbi:MAG: hypothetical protein KatS3mg119_0430 [Rhodothalassiaceae bacterium]|nr:MAG: hypothetical protein KatS3mg119_0430 [Rhodothalassiaceae bacterium]
MASGRAGGRARLMPRRAGRDGETDHGRQGGEPPHHPRPARHRARGAKLAHRSAAAHAHEQSRPRGRRESGRARRLRRHRQGGARLGRVREDRRDPEAAPRRRNAAGAVRQAGRRLPHACGCAAGADRQFQSRAALGELGAFPRARPQGPHHVRADDGGLLDLHRLAGHHPGHLRDLRRDGPAALWRRSCRPLAAHRRPRRHGRRAAAGGDHGGDELSRSRMPDEPDREAHGDRVSRPLDRGSGRGARDHHAQHRRAQAGLGRPSGQCRRGAARAPRTRRASRCAHRPDLGA